MRQLILAITLSLISSSGFGLETIDALECVSAGGENSVVLYDSFEARTLRPELVVELGEPQLPALSKVRRVLQRLKRLDPERSTKYLSAADLFLEQVQFLENAGFSLPSSESLIVPTGCSLKTVGVHRTDGIEKNFLISQPLWRKLDQNDRAALILHFLVAREIADKKTKPPAERVRHFVQALCSDVFSIMSVPRYSELVRALFAQADPGIFKQNVFYFIAPVARVFNLELDQLLSSGSAAQFHWRWKNQGLKWLTLNDLGSPQLSGIPSLQNLGSHEETLVAISKVSGQSSSTILHFEVIDGNFFIQNPLDLGSIRMRQVYSFDITERIFNPAGERIRFSMAHGPAWLKLESESILSGIPSSEGPFQAIIVLERPGFPKASITLFGTVTP